SGMTFVHSWCHNVRSAAHAEADVRALAEVGIRARHSCGGKLMGKDAQLIHTLSASAAELDMIKETGSAVSVSPRSALRIGSGYPQTNAMLAKGIPVGISVDTSTLGRRSNPFSLPKLSPRSQYTK